jgi:hypothetical protein
LPLKEKPNGIDQRTKKPATRAPASADAPFTTANFSPESVGVGLEVSTLGLVAEGVVVSVLDAVSDSVSDSESESELVLVLGSGVDCALEEVPQGVTGVES